MSGTESSSESHQSQREQTESGGGEDRTWTQWSDEDWRMWNEGRWLGEGTTSNSAGFQEAADSGATWANGREGYRTNSQTSSTASQWVPNRSG